MKHTTDKLETVRQAVLSGNASPAGVSTAALRRIITDAALVNAFAAAQQVNRSPKDDTHIREVIREYVARGRQDAAAPSHRADRWGDSLWGLLFACLDELGQVLLPEHDFRRDSEQKRLLKVMSSQKGKRLDAEKLFSAARDSAIDAATDILLDLVMVRLDRNLAVAEKKKSKVSGEQLDPTFLLLVRLFQLSPEIVLPHPYFRRYADGLFEKGDLSLVTALANVQAKTSRRISNSELNINPLRIAIVRHWVDPDRPLWLASNPAAAQLLGFLANETVTGDNVKQLKGRYSLVACPSPVIRDVRLKRAPREIIGFDLRRGYEPGSKVVTVP